MTQKPCYSVGLYLIFWRRITRTLQVHGRSLIPILIIFSLILSMFPVPAESQSQQLAFATTVSNAAAGNTYYVSLSGSDSNPGTQSQPFRTIQHAADVAQPGNRILVKAGTYYERIALKNSGRAGSPIVIEGERGPSGERLTVIDGSDPLTGWVRTNTWGVWQTTNIPYEIGWLGVDDKHILKMVRPYESELDLEHLDYPPDFHVGMNYITGYINVYYWDVFEALWTGGNPAYVRFRNGDDPNTKNMRSSPRYGSTIFLDNVSHVDIKGFQIRGGFYEVHFKSGASDITLEENEIINGWATVLIEGPSRITIRNNVIHQNRVTDKYLPGPMNIPASESGTSPAPGTWQYRAGVADHFNWYWKQRTVGNGVGIDMVYNGNQQGISDSEIYGNRIYDYPGHDLTIMNTRNLKIYNNDISHTSDSGILIYTNLRGVEVYDNWLHDDSINFRTQAVGDPAIQEVYIYRNRFHQPVFPSGRPAFWCCSGWGDETTADHRIYWYHNSFLGSDREALGLARTDFSNTTYFLNNVFSSQSTFNWDAGGENKAIALFDYNWVGGAKQGYIVPHGYMELGPHNVLAYGQQMWDVSQASDFRLPPGSAARNAGIDVTSPEALALLKRSSPLPGFQPGYFAGPAPNMGVYQDIDTPQTFNFSLSNGGNKSVTRGSSVSNTISATLISGTAQSVSYVVFGLPSGVTASFSPNSCSPTCSTTLTLNASASAASGTFLITVSATGGGAPKTTTFNLIGLTQKATLGVARSKRKR